MADTIDVAQLVIRTEVDGEDRYLLARRTFDGTWEFVGGKREPGETIEAAAKRELDEELASVPPERAEVRTVGTPYRSGVDERFLLHPVLVALPRSLALEIDDDDLSGEHETMTWVTVAEFDRYDTVGQYEALETLGLVDS